MHKAAFTPDNAAMLLIDHQIGTMAWTHSHDINLVNRMHSSLLGSPRRQDYRRF